MRALQDNKEEELAIDSIHGLKVLLSYVEDAYQAFIVKAQSADGNSTETLMRHVEAIYTETNALITRYIKILNWGGEMSVDQVELLQNFYNQLIEAYDTLTETLSVAPVVTITDEVQKAAFLLDKGAQLMEEFADIETAKVVSSEIKLGQVLYSKLRAGYARTQEIVDEVEELLATSRPEEMVYVMQHFGQELDSLEKDFDQLEIGLSRLFESVVGSVQTPKAISNKKEATKKLFSDTSPFTTHIHAILAMPKYAHILKEHFSSPAAFEAALRREVYRVEAPSRLDSLLKVKHGSAFSFLNNMSLAEIDRFDGTQNREMIRAKLKEKNVPYEIYMNWIEALPYMESLLETTDEMLFGELFVYSEVELLLENTTT